MKRVVIILGLAGITALAGCSSNRIIIDKKGVSMAQYARDLEECRAYAEEVRVAEQAAEGAAVGGVVGGAIGAIFGDSSTAARGAGAGAVSGAASGTGRAVHEKDRVVKTCLRGRGYKVLN